MRKKQAKKRKPRITRKGWALLPNGTEMRYGDYIRSEYWAAVKARYRSSRLPQRCLGCDNLKVEMHHRTYKRLGHEHLADLVPVCRDCHQAIHDRDNKRPDRGLWRNTKQLVKRKRRKILKKERIKHGLARWKEEEQRVAAGNSARVNVVTGESRGYPS